MCCAVLSIGCAAPGSDIALAPLWTRLSTADGGVEIEAAAGLWRQRFDATTGRFESVTVGPFYSLDYASPERLRRTGPHVGPDSLPPLSEAPDEADGSGASTLGAGLSQALSGGAAPERDSDWLSRFLVPLGYTSHRGGETASTLLPVYLWRDHERVDGSRQKDFYSILGLISRWNERKGHEISWFPFYGNFDDLFTYDKIVFVGWPFFVYAERNEQISYHMPWPLLGWVRGGGESSDHLLPLYTRASVEGRYKRWALLWPFFHLQFNHLGGGQEARETAWWVFPLLGRKTRGTYQSTSFLWPFFGYSSDPRSGFWSFDGPWPLVRVQRGPGDVTRTRFWPLFSHHHAQGLTTRTFLWPIVQLRHEEGTRAVRDTTWILPIWQSWDRLDREDGEPTGGSAAWRKLFPVFQYEREDHWRRGSFPTLDPFWRNELIDRHYSWIWKLYEWEEDGERGTRSERSWGGLWRRERDTEEDRASFTFLWSRRRYRVRSSPVVEHALLFGLLRWRVTEDDGFAMLRPAFPGPGWPARAGAGAAPTPASAHRDPSTAPQRAD